MDNKVSIIIPTYKRSKFLSRAVDSALNQTYPHIEVVVVDDNPPDSIYRFEAMEVMAKYGDDKRVIYIKNEKNLGGALARNEGIWKSSGNYITFLDDDDIYLPDKVRNQMEYMIANDVEMSFADVRIHNSTDKLIDYREHSYIGNMCNEELLKQHIMHHLTPTATYMYKRKSIMRIGGFDDAKVGQEFLLMLKTIESGMKIGYIPKAQVIQYVHSGERISIGEKKIKGEKDIYNNKKKYFHRLSERQRRYVKFRYHAVMVVVGIRSRKSLTAVNHLFSAFFTSPTDCLNELKEQIRKLRKYDKCEI
ncbi:MAG: glycosyltransferase [Firmicutes bacterium]|nr:glycosyltransferase [Bacillota bacterium]